MKCAAWIGSPADPQAQLTDGSIPCRKMSNRSSSQPGSLGQVLQSTSPGGSLLASIGSSKSFKRNSISGNTKDDGPAAYLDVSSAEALLKSSSNYSSQGRIQSAEPIPSHAQQACRTSSPGLCKQRQRPKTTGCNMGCTAAAQARAASAGEEGKTGSRGSQHQLSANSSLPCQEAQQSGGTCSSSAADDNLTGSAVDAAMVNRRRRWNDNVNPLAEPAFEDALRAWQEDVEAGVYAPRFLGSFAAVSSGRIDTPAATIQATTTPSKRPKTGGKRGLGITGTQSAGTARQEATSGACECMPEALTAAAAVTPAVFQGSGENALQALELLVLRQVVDKPRLTLMQLQRSVRAISTLDSPCQLAAIGMLLKGGCWMAAMQVAYADGFSLLPGVLQEMRALIEVGLHWDDQQLAAAAWNWATIDRDLFMHTFRRSELCNHYQQLRRQLNKLQQLAQQAAIHQKQRQQRSPLSVCSGPVGVSSARLATAPHPELAKAERAMLIAIIDSYLDTLAAAAAATAEAAAAEAATAAGGCSVGCYAGLPLDCESRGSSRGSKHPEAARSKGGSKFDGHGGSPLQNSLRISSDWKILLEGADGQGSNDGSDSESSISSSSVSSSSHDRSSGSEDGMNRPQPVTATGASTTAAVMFRPGSQPFRPGPQALKALPHVTKRNLQPKQAGAAAKGTLPASSVDAWQPTAGSAVSGQRSPVRATPPASGQQPPVLRQRRQEKPRSTHSPVHQQQQQAHDAPACAPMEEVTPQLPLEQDGHVTSVWQASQQQVPQDNQDASLQEAQAQIQDQPEPPKAPCSRPQSHQTSRRLSSAQGSRPGSSQAPGPVTSVAPGQQQWPPAVGTFLSAMSWNGGSSILPEEPSLSPAAAGRHRPASAASGPSNLSRPSSSSLAARQRPGSAAGVSSSFWQQQQPPDTAAEAGLQRLKESCAQHRQEIEEWANKLTTASAAAATTSSSAANGSTAAKPSAASGPGSRPGSAAAGLEGVSSYRRPGSALAAKSASRPGTAGSLPDRAWSRHSSASLPGASTSSSVCGEDLLMSASKALVSSPVSLRPSTADSNMPEPASVQVDGSSALNKGASGSSSTGQQQGQRSLVASSTFSRPRSLSPVPHLPLLEAGVIWPDDDEEAAASSTTADAAGITGSDIGVAGSKVEDKGPMPFHAASPPSATAAAATRPVLERKQSFLQKFLQGKGTKEATSTAASIKANSKLQPKAQEKTQQQAKQPKQQRKQMPLQKKTHRQRQGVAQNAPAPAAEKPAAAVTTSPLDQAGQVDSNKNASAKAAELSFTISQPPEDGTPGAADQAPTAQAATPTAQVATPAAQAAAPTAQASTPTANELETIIDHYCTDPEQLTVTPDVGVVAQIASDGANSSASKAVGQVQVHSSSPDCASTGNGHDGSLGSTHANQHVANQGSSSTVTATQPTEAAAAAIAPSMAAQAKEHLGNTLVSSSDEATIQCASGNAAAPLAPESIPVAAGAPKPVRSDEATVEEAASVMGTAATAPVKDSVSRAVAGNSDTAPTAVVVTATVAAAKELVANSASECSDTVPPAAVAEVPATASPTPGMDHASKRANSTDASATAGPAGAHVKEASPAMKDHVASTRSSSSGAMPAAEAPAVTGLTAGAGAADEVSSSTANDCAGNADSSSIYEAAVTQAVAAVGVVTASALLESVREPVNSMRKSSSGGAAAEAARQPADAVADSVVAEAAVSNVQVAPTKPSSTARSSSDGVVAAPLKQAVDKTTCDATTGTAAAGSLDNASSLAATDEAQAAGVTATTKAISSAAAKEHDSSKKSSSADISPSATVPAKGASEGSSAVVSAAQTVDAVLQEPTSTVKSSAASARRRTSNAAIPTATAAAAAAVAAAKALAAAADVPSCSLSGAGQVEQVDHIEKVPNNSTVVQAAAAIGDDADALQGEEPLMVELTHTMQRFQQELQHTALMARQLMVQQASAQAARQAQSTAAARRSSNSSRPSSASNGSTKKSAAAAHGSSSSQHSNGLHAKGNMATAGPAAHPGLGPQTVVGLDGLLEEDEPPTAAEVEEYARYLGMDPVQDADLLYIAEAALVAPLPAGWTVHLDAQGNEFFHNTASMESTYEHPMDQSYRQQYQQMRLQRKQ